MKKFILLAIIVISILPLTAQEKTGNDFKEEGITAFKSDDFTTAFTAFEKAMEMYVKEGVVDTPLYYNAAYCAYQSKKFEPAVKYFEKSIELNYKNEKSYLFIANSYKKSGNDEAYGRALDSAIVYFPDNAKLMKMQGMRYFGDGLAHYNKASEYSQTAASMVESDPEGFKKNKELADTEYRAALPLLEKSLKLYPKIKNLNEALINVYEALDMKDQAEALKSKTEEMH